jgi:hypothetical protein
MRNIGWILISMCPLCRWHEENITHLFAVLFSLICKEHEFFLSYHFQYTMILCYNYESIQEMVRNWFYLSLNRIKKIFSWHWWLQKSLTLLLLLHPKSSDSPMDYATRLTKRLNKYASIYKSQV